MSNFVVTSLPAYVQENRDLLIKNFALVGGETRKRISVQTGIKKDEYINYLNLTPTFQSGAGCGFNAQGGAALTQRLIETARFKVNMEFCPDTLVGKYAEYQVSINASENASLPFEAFIMEALTNEIVKKIETTIWQGVKASDLIDGFLTIAKAESDVVDVTIAGTSSSRTLLLWGARPGRGFPYRPESRKMNTSTISISLRPFSPEQVADSAHRAGLLSRRGSLRPHDSRSIWNSARILSLANMPNTRYQSMHRKMLRCRLRLSLWRHSPTRS